MKVIAGLGNIGPRYASTRHNAGFLVVQELARRHAIRIAQALPSGRSPVALIGDGRVAGAVARLVLPQTMMNLSGEALRWLREWKVDAAELLLVCDDVNLPLGQLRARAEGGAGGHHGLMSCFEVLGTEQVPRLRVGVGTTPLPRDLTEFVVSEFENDERPAIERAIAQAADACELWAARGVTVMMNRANVRAREDRNEAGS